MRPPKNPNSLLRQEVDAIAQAKGWNLSGVASALDMTVSMLSKILHRNDPSAAFLQKLSALETTCPKSVKQKDIAAVAEALKPELRVAPISWQLPVVAKRWPEGSVVITREKIDASRRPTHPFDYRLILWFRPDRITEAPKPYRNGMEFGLIALPEK